MQVIPSFPLSNRHPNHGLCALDFIIQNGLKGVGWHRHINPKGPAFGPKAIGIPGQIIRGAGEKGVGGADGLLEVCLPSPLAGWWADLGL